MQEVTDGKDIKDKPEKECVRMIIEFRSLSKSRITDSTSHNC